MSSDLERVNVETDVYLRQKSRPISSGGTPRAPDHLPKPEPMMMVPKVSMCNSKEK
jgi:hypothetical protein